MTVIAWDGKTLAADRMCSSGPICYRIRKIFRIKDSLIGIIGVIDQASYILDWAKSGCHESEYPFEWNDDIDAEIVMIKNNKIYRYQNCWKPVHIKEKIMAFGSGRDVALGSMEMGADAKTAVRIASKWCNNCGLGVDCLTI